MDMKKVIFRELTEEDAEELYKIYSNKEAMKYRGSKAMESIEDARLFVRNQKMQEEDTFTIRKGIEIKEGKQLIGTVMCRFFEAREWECEIGYSIGQEYWGQGLGKEVVKLLVEVIESKEEVGKIVAWSKKENIASIKVLEKNGFELVEQMRYLDSHLYSREKKN